MIEVTRAVVGKAKWRLRCLRWRAVAAVVGRRPSQLLISGDKPEAAGTTPHRTRPIPPKPKFPMSTVRDLNLHPVEPSLNQPAQHVPEENAGPHEDRGPAKLGRRGA